MSLLVTGGAGFIGTNFVRHRRATRPGEHLVVLDLLTYAGHERSLVGVDGITFVHGDVTDRPLLDRLMAEHAVDAVVHLAAETHVDRSIHDPMAFVKTNVLGTATLLEAAKHAGVRRFVHVSTDEVYGDLDAHAAPFTEASPLRPRSPYAASKAGADHLVLAQIATWGTARVPAVIVRCSNNYGPYQYPEKLLPLVILSALADRPIPVYGDGENVRDWIHVSDTVRGLALALDAAAPGTIVHLGGGAERSNLELVESVLALVGKDRSLIRFVADRPGHDRRYALSTERTTADLGFAPEVDLARGLADTIAWYRANVAWSEAVTAGAYRDWIRQHYGALA